MIRRHEEFYPDHGHLQHAQHHHDLLQHAQHHHVRMNNMFYAFPGAIGEAQNILPSLHRTYPLPAHGLDADNRSQSARFHNDSVNAEMAFLPIRRVAAKHHKNIAFMAEGMHALVDLNTMIAEVHKEGRLNPNSRIEGSNSTDLRSKIGTPEAASIEVRGTTNV